MAMAIGYRFEPSNNYQNIYMGVLHLLKQGEMPTVLGQEITSLGITPKSCIFIHQTLNL